MMATSVPIRHLPCADLDMYCHIRSGCCDAGALVWPAIDYDQAVEANADAAKEATWPLLSPCFAEGNNTCRHQGRANRFARIGADWPPLEAKGERVRALDLGQIVLRAHSQILHTTILHFFYS